MDLWYWKWKHVGCLPHHPVFLLYRYLWRFLAWGEVGERPGILRLGEHRVNPPH